MASAFIGRLILAGGLALAATQGHAQAPAPASNAGETLYVQHCAGCHEAGAGHAPSREALGRRSPVNIMLALRAGAMKPQAAGLTLDDMGAISAFLTADAAAKAVPLKPNLCIQAPAPLKLDGPAWNGWGRDARNSRFQPQPGLAAKDVGRLKLKWAYAYPGAQTWGQPTVVGGRVFVAATTGDVYALDAASGCALWTFTAGAPVRNAISIGAGPQAGQTVAYFGDQSAWVYAVDANTGKELWRTRLDDHPMARMTGAPALYGDRLYVPVSSAEEGAASQPGYACCTFRGSVAAVDTASGKIAWQTRTIDQAPQPYHRQNNPVGLFGPAGGAVWNTPTIDAKRGLLYVGTGNDYTDIDVKTTDAVMAMDLKTGRIAWSRQLYPRDHWQAGCTYGTVCPDDAGPDYDVAASTILIRLKSGKDVLVIGQKSGVVTGLDPAAKGRLLWRRPLGSGSIFGGIEWGMAAIGSSVYAPISDSATPAPAKAKPGLGAVDAATGRQLWWAPAPKPDCDWGEVECRGAQSQAASAIPGVVFSGSEDGHLRAYDAKSGKVVWDVDTAAQVQPVNAAKASGGSLDTGGATVVGGVLYVNSGYGQFLGHGGNVMLAYSVDGK